MFAVSSAAKDLTLIRFSLLNILTLIKKTVKILNVSGLRLENLSFLSGFIRLEQLIAIDNRFKCTSVITDHMSNIPTVIQADFRGCPAQHDFHYRNRILSSCDSLRNLTK